MKNEIDREAELSEHAYIVSGAVVGVLGFALMVYAVGWVAAFAIFIMMFGSNIQREARWFRIRRVFNNGAREAERLLKVEELRRRGQL